MLAEIANFKQTFLTQLSDTTFSKITTPYKSRSVVIIGHEARVVMKLVGNHD